jgi:hypothetical protein
MLKLRLELTNDEGDNLTAVEITDSEINHSTEWLDILWICVNALCGVGHVIDKVELEERIGR